MSPRLYVINMEAVTHEIRSTVKPSYARVILKRAFYRLAEKIAAETDAAALLNPVIARSS